jgi:signal transduction histidine kinase
MAARPSRLPYLLAIVWLVFTVSLASWWLSVGLTFADRYQMFLWEGITFIVVLIAGGVAIVWAIHREQRRREAVETFFMSFTHDLKTSLARVQLEAEGLREDWPDATARDSVDRLLHDTLRLQIQLENSLFVAQPDGRLLRERVDVPSACERLAADWPDLAVHVTGRGHVLADARAFDAVIRNLLQNSVVHGGASRVEVAIAPAGGRRAGGVDGGAGGGADDGLRLGGGVAADSHATGDSGTGRVRISVTDAGRGVARGQLALLGELGAKPSETSATGVGLFVSRQLVSRMGGALTFEQAQPDGRGLRVIIELAGAAGAER